MNPVRRYADNIIAIYLDADEVTREAGSRWYLTERARLVEWGEANGVSPRGAIGAAAAISPGMPWEWVTVYLSALRKSPDAKVPTYSREFVRRAVRCMQGEDPFAVLSGLKVTAFYHCLWLWPEGGDVVVDGHAWNIARGGQGPIRAGVSNEGRVTPARYRLAAEAYRLAAEDMSIWPSDVQATTWLHWRMLTKR